MTHSLKPSLGATSQERLSVRCRADLVAVETSHKHESAVVVKDPIALKYHRLRPDEFFVLERLDGTRSLEQIRKEYEDTFPPHRVTASELNQLLFRFHQSGLTVSDASMQGDRLGDRRRKDQRERLLQHLSGVLFIRFPGVDPEPFLRRLYPWLRPCLSPMAMAFAMVLCAAALLVFVANWQRFADEFPRMNQWLRLDSVLILAAVIGVTKVMHELGHAVICRHFGGECHQIGPMLLVFTPALYCDTSDSWMLPSRWQRAAVGLAGIGVEVLLAALATFLWVSTAPGLIHYVSMNVMLVCSVSTLLFNANPLLRYDGYYVLADLCDVPNLGERSRALLAHHLSGWALGVEEEPPEVFSGWGRLGMLAYAVMAAVYRWGLTLLILWFVSLMLRPYGLESLGRLLCVFAAAGLLYAILRRPLRFLGNPSRRRMLKMKRMVWSGGVAVGLAALACVPMPSGISADARILPRHETTVYISTPGLLHNVAVRPGELVREGDELATLVNRDVETRYLAVKGRYEAQRQLVDTLRRSQFLSPETAAELPAAETLLRDLQRQLETQEQRRAGLVIRSPASGKLIAAPRRPVQPANDFQLVSWSGYPTDPENESCYLESGLELMSVVEEDLWDAEMVLSQSEVQRFAVGAMVKLVSESQPARVLRGRVTDISRSRWNEGENAQRRDDLRAARREGPKSTSYVVRVELNEASEARFVAGAAASARIEAEPISLVARTSRFLNGLFRFR